MSTLSLADLGPKTRRALGLEITCNCESSLGDFVASIPVIAVEVARPRAPESPDRDLPGAVWLKTGLHRLRIPAVQSLANAVVDRPGTREQLGISSQVARTD